MLADLFPLILVRSPVTILMVAVLVGLWPWLVIPHAIVNGYDQLGIFVLNPIRTLKLDDFLIK